jgi:hypothetical protein
MYNTSHGIRERTLIIPIQKIITTEKITPKNEYKKEYGLNQNLFDPTKSSPPNDFMIKLHMRNKIYNLSHKKEDKLEIQ